MVQQQPTTVSRPTRPVVLRKSRRRLRVWKFFSPGGGLHCRFAILDSLCRNYVRDPVVWCLDSLIIEVL